MERTRHKSQRRLSSSRLLPPDRRWIRHRLHRAWSSDRTSSDIRAHVLRADQRSSLQNQNRCLQRHLHCQLLWLTVEILSGAEHSCSPRASPDNLSRADADRPAKRQDHAAVDGAFGQRVSHHQLRPVQRQRLRGLLRSVQGPRPVLHRQPACRRKRNVQGRRCQRSRYWDGVSPVRRHRWPEAIGSPQFQNYDAIDDCPCCRVGPA
mmetsp:Transcript_39217/g.44948  ORF Transcript_39217/g.44948 Transcript_39217/m.44948 type:complete len:207 (-) Transcript_39217:1620-2240(-)